MNTIPEYLRSTTLLVGEPPRCLLPNRRVRLSKRDAAACEGEEPHAHGTFFKLARYRMGLLVIAPYDPARYDPVYREAIKYHLPTNRHNRLSTSYGSIKSRVYYVEDPETLNAMYACADFVVAGGTLCAAPTLKPDILAPALSAVPVIVGP